jgi:hypothetical protein
MTMTVTPLGNPQPHIAGDIMFRLVELDITSYTTDGESVAADVLGFSKIDALIPASSEKGYMFRWDRANGKILAYTDATTQATSTTDCGTVVAVVFGY